MGRVGSAKRPVINDGIGQTLKSICKLRAWLKGRTSREREREIEYADGTQADVCTIKSTAVAVGVMKFR